MSLLQMKAIESKGVEDDLIGRPALAYRWKCHTETLKRREKQGLLHPLQLSTRMVRYRMSEVLAIEHDASGDGSAAHLQQPASSNPSPRGQSMKKGKPRQKRSAASQPSPAADGVKVDFTGLENSTT